MFEVLTWEAAFTIVASIVTITTGLFAYLIKTKNGNSTKEAYKRQSDDVLEELRKDSREITDRLIIIESEVRMLVQHGKNTNRRIDDHEEQDRRDFTHLEGKIDKLTDILMKILTDDKL